MGAGHLACTLWSLNVCHEGLGFPPFFSTSDRKGSSDRERRMPSAAGGLLGLLKETQDPSQRWSWGCQKQGTVCFYRGTAFSGTSPTHSRATVRDSPAGSPIPPTPPPHLDENLTVPGTFGGGGQSRTRRAGVPGPFMRPDITFRGGQQKSRILQSNQSFHNVLWGGWLAVGELS